MSQKKILFFCQNLLGLGHLARTSEILLHLRGHAEVCVVFGGELVEGLPAPAARSFVPLPALRRENGELKVVGSDMTLAEVMDARRDRLLSVWRQFDPDVVVIEGYPFAKKALAFELIPLLKEISSRESRPAVFCSIRDVVLAKDRELLKSRDKEKAIWKVMNKYYDGLLVHSTSGVLSLKERFTHIERLNCPVHYTGYVVQSFPPPPPDAALSDGTPTVLVSVGGGRLGRSLLDCILDTAPMLTGRVPHQLLVFTGPFLTDDEFAAIAARADGQSNLVVRRYTPSLLHHMANADLSISLCGYNTAMNIIRTGVRALVLPSLKDREQPIRAERFAEYGILEELTPADLTASIMTERIVGALQQPRREAQLADFDLNGGENSARILLAAGRIAQLRAEPAGPAIAADLTSHRGPTL
jgi:predicted glycosyltransferase